MSLFEPIQKSLCLQQLCETNYRKLMQLVPQLLTLEEGISGSAPQKTALHLRIIDRSPYTLTIEFNHHFGQAPALKIEPALKIRVYADAKSVEVLSDQYRPRVHEVFQASAKANAVMDYKFRLNYFLSKWLDHCLLSRYQFQAA